MIHVVFDSNIFFGPVKKMANSGLSLDNITLEDFCRLRDDNGVVPYLTLPNFMEYIMGIGSENFEMCVKEAQIFSIVTRGGSILEFPLQLVHRECSMILAGKHIPMSDPSLKDLSRIPLMMGRLSNAKKWEEVKPEIELFQAKMKSFKFQRNESYEKIARSTFKLSKDKRSEMIKKWPKAFATMMKQLKIPEELLSLDAEFVFGKIFSLRYRFAAFWGCASRKILNGEQMLFADYGDVEQGCYMSVADYWVTNDPRARQNLVTAEEIGLLSSNEVSPRILNWSEFVTKLVKRELAVGIAPCKTKSVKYLRSSDENFELLSN